MGSNVGHQESIVYPTVLKTAPFKITCHSSRQEVCSLQVFLCKLSTAKDKASVFVRPRIASKSIAFKEFYMNLTKTEKTAWNNFQFRISWGIARLKIMLRTWWRTTIKYSAECLSKPKNMGFERHYHLDRFKKDMEAYSKMQSEPLLPVYTALSSRRIV